MTAALLNHHLPANLFNIMLIESPDVSIIGVGEGSTPQLRNFFNLLGIDESDWMPACHATFKNGIRFSNWTSGKSKNSYFHPFPSITDRQTAAEFLINCHKRQNGSIAHTDPDSYFLAAQLASNGQGPKTSSNEHKIAINYAYHFDSGLVGKFIQAHCSKKGVQHIKAHVTEVKQHPNGSISSLTLSDAREIQADWFFDCTGFQGLLIQKTLNTPFIPFKQNLFNDRAIAIPSLRCDTFEAQTTSTALDYGWAWRIPLTHRTGNGYVYSSDYCSPDDAERELRQHLGLLDSTVEARHLKMNVGRCENTWVNNCIAVGLSQGFIEPLEATALHIVHETVEKFISAFAAGGYSTQHQNQYNEVINARIEGIRDYIVCHFQVSNRKDTQYWRDNSENCVRSDSLKHILDVWVKGGDLTAEINRQQIAHYYPSVSWHCLLAGYDFFNHRQRDKTSPSEQVQQHIAQLTRYFKPHNSILNAN